MRISVLAAALTPALTAVILAATGSGAGVLRVAVICAVTSAAAVVELLRRSRIGYGRDLAARRREREHLDGQLDEVREAHADTMTRLAGRERELATVRERETRLREGDTRLRERIAKLEVRAKTLEARTDEALGRAKRADARAAESEVRAAEAEKRAAELDALVWDLPSRPVRLTRELLTRGAASLRNLEREATRSAEVDAEPVVAPVAPVAARVAEPVAAQGAVGSAAEAAAVVAEAASTGGAAAVVAAESDVEGNSVDEPAPKIAPVAEVASFDEPAQVEGPAPVDESAPVVESKPVDEPVGTAAPVVPGIPGVRHRPIAVEGLVPAYAAAMYGLRPAAPIAPRPELPAARLPVPRPPAELVVPQPADEDAPALDLGIGSLEPAVTALPADDAVARVMRDVADTVRATNQRMSRSQSASSFDFFGRQLPAGGAGAVDVTETADVTVRPQPQALASEAQTSGTPETQASETQTSGVPASETPAAAAPRAVRAPRDAGPRIVPVGPRPLVTHEPRTGRPIPVDLTAHDDTEQLPKIVDDRRHA